MVFELVEVVAVVVTTDVTVDPTGTVTELVAVVALPVAVTTTVEVLGLAVVVTVDPPELCDEDIWYTSASAVRLNTAPGSSKELGAVGHPPKLALLNPQIKS